MAAILTIKCYSKIYRKKQLFFVVVVVVKAEAVRRERRLWACKDRE